MVSQHLDSSYKYTGSVLNSLDRIWSAVNRTDWFCEYWIGSGLSGPVMDLLERCGLRSRAHPEVSEPRTRDLSQATTSGRRSRSWQRQLLLRANVRGGGSARRHKPCPRIRRHVEVPPVRRYFNVRHRPFLLTIRHASPIETRFIHRFCSLYCMLISVMSFRLVIAQRSFSADLRNILLCLSPCRRGIIKR